jgi:hypothetical protein
LNSDLACPTCGTTIVDRYCPRCGERRLVAHDLSLRHYAEELFDVSTHVDSKLLRSAWLLLRRPGQLSVNYLAGRRVHWVSPLRLFVFVSIVYFISLSLLHGMPFHLRNPTIQFNTFATPLATQLHGNDFYPNYAARRVAEKMRHDGSTYAQLEQRYDEKTSVLSKTTVFVLIPVIAALFGALFLRKRRYFAEHLVIATHFWAFALVLIGILLPAVVLPAMYLLDAAALKSTGIINDVSVSYVLQLVFAGYLYFMLRRAYSASAWYSAVVALMIAWSFFFIVWLFRYFLFEITLLAV